VTAPDSFVAQDIIMQVFLVVDLAHNLREALGCQCSGLRASLERADAKTLAEQQLLAESSYE
jgi:hypothetical protein